MDDTSKMPRASRVWQTRLTIPKLFVQLKTLEAAWLSLAETNDWLAGKIPPDSDGRHEG